MRQHVRVRDRARQRDPLVPDDRLHRATRRASTRRGTGAEINNIGSLSEAKHLALVLQTGALPVQFKTLERTDVSATLGKDSLKQAQNARSAA